MIANDDLRVLSESEMEAVVGGRGPIISLPPPPPPQSGDPTADD